MFNFLKKLFLSKEEKEEKSEDFDKIYKTNQNIKSENYEVDKYIPMIKKLKK
jgi:hypothetical protein